MNPFDLYGPEFLLFYLALSIATLVALFVLRGNRESGRAFPEPKLTDPYLIAYLRGGGSAAIESAVVSLVDRNILDADVDGIFRRKGLNPALFIDPLERAIVEDLETPLAPAKLMAKSFPQPFSGYDRTLARLGLLPDEEEKSARLNHTLAAGIFLAVVAGIKIAVALSRGRTNIALLIILSIAALIAIVVAGNPRSTKRGKNVLADLKTLFEGLKARADYLTPGKSAGELALVTALYGAAALPLAAFPLREKVFPTPQSSSDGGGGSSDGGSSCGGGGCGGGCGGCGS